LPCAFCPSARQRAPGAFLPGKELCRALLKKGNTSHSSLPCVIYDARQRKGVDGRPRGDDVTPSLPCAAEHAREQWYSLSCATWLGARQRVVKAHS
jgi:hypothetical protein